MKYFIRLVIALTLILPIVSIANDFVSDEQENRYRQLIDEIRCPVCQGQSIGGSNADLSKTLRDQVKKMILNSQSDQEIKGFMVERYGEFVDFKPRLDLKNYILYFAPVVFLMIGVLVFIRSFYKVNKNSKKIDTSKAKKFLKD
ncbi:cytochrome c-type biogenesis protein CcmH [Gammaproteobacteria bacterium]|nr:cytochrome c-type biogenesis protein CcmH [Gammaproteobacteria bacterium]